MKQFRQNTIKHILKNEMIEIKQKVGWAERLLEGCQLPDKSSDDILLDIGKFLRYSKLFIFCSMVSRGTLACKHWSKPFDPVQQGNQKV
jgi:hypothetical protein